MPGYPRGTIGGAYEFVKGWNIGGQAGSETYPLYGDTHRY